MRPLLIAFLSSFIATAAVAKSENIKVPANKTSPISSLSTFNKSNCTHGPIAKAQIKKAPKFGKITVKKMAGKATKGKCKGHMMKHTVVFYTPKRGFRGKDEVIVKFRYPKYANHPGDVSYTKHYRLNVR